MMSKRISKNQQTAQQEHCDPVFIHSLWRAGSTYLFSVFRRSSAGYWCYQEPVHEIALLSKDKPGELLVYTGENMAALRHPLLAEPYFLELYETSKYWSDVISKSIIYDDYFGGASNGGLTKYLSALITHAKGRPVIQECRTSCRIGTLKRALGGTHIYLWRNPWDQWWSYKSTNYFDITNQLILNAPGHPEAITRLRNDIGFDEFHDEDIAKEFAYFDRKRMSAEHSYLTFYLLWCLGLLEGMGSADLLLNIDKLSTEQTYRDDIQKHLLQFGIKDINFSDCNVPQAYYDKSDRAFFSSQEERAHVLLLLSGYSKAKLKKLAVLRQSSEPKIWAISASKIPAEKLLSDAVRAREIVLRTESENAARLVRSAVHQAQEIRLHEQIITEQLATQQQPTAQESAEREQGLHSELAAMRETLARVQIAAAESEKALSGLAQQTLEKARNEAQIHLREIIERERNFTNQLTQAHSDAKQSVAEQARAHADQTSQIRQKLENLLRTQAQREQEVTAQLLVIQQQASQEMAEQARSHTEQERALRRQHTEREQALSQQLQAVHQELHRLEQERAQREKEHAEQYSQVRQELEDLQHTQMQREQEVAVQLLTIQQQATQEMAEQARSHIEQERALRRQHAEREQALSQQLQAVHQELHRLEQDRTLRERALDKEITALQSEIQALNHAQQLREQQHGIELSIKQDEYSRLIQASKDIEAELKAQILSEQQTSMHLRQAHAEVRKHLEMAHASLTWRLTRPLRSLAAFIAPQNPTPNPPVIEDVVPQHAIVPHAIESPLTDVEQVSIEDIMHPSAQATNQNTAVLASALTLDELLARHDQLFVHYAYQIMLGRNPDPEGKNYYLRRLRSGVSKIEILSQLRDSSEGKARAADLPGLQDAIRRYRLSHVPILGSFYKVFTGAGRMSGIERQLASIENRVAVMNERSTQRFDQLEQSIATLQRLTIQQAQSLMNAVSTSAGPVRVEQPTAPTFVLPSTPEEATSLSPRAMEVSRQIKSAITNNLIKQGAR